MLVSHTNLPEASTESSPWPVLGRDEMNLAEFPITLITDRAPKGVSTLVFKSKEGNLTIKGTAADGLPTASDADVIVALIYLTKIRNDFSDPTVNFSRYELLKLLNWSNEGKNYKRLNLSFDRWHGVTLKFEKCWWDNTLKRNIDASIHILESVIIADRADHRSTDGSPQLPLSSFTWNKQFFESCQADNLKRLDLDTYFSLKLPSTKRLYRFLDKRFYVKDDWTFDLYEIAHDRVGLSRNYSDAGEVKEKLQPAVDELTEIGFLTHLKREERYSKAVHGHWNIRFVRNASRTSRQIFSSSSPKTNEHTTSDGSSPVDLERGKSPALVTELVNRGVTELTAEELVHDHDFGKIETQIEVFDWLIESKDKRIAKSPGGYLVDSIRKSYSAPKGFISKEERQRRSEAQQAKDQATANERRRKQEDEAREQAERDAIDHYWASLTPDQKADLEQKAMTQADPETIKLLELGPLRGPMRGVAMKIIRDRYITQLLAANQRPTAPSQ